MGNMWRVCRIIEAVTAALSRHYIRLLLDMCSINSSASQWANIYCRVTHPLKCSGQLPWQPAQTADEIRAGAVALRESLGICLLTPPFSLCMREAEHKQQRWLAPACSPRPGHHHAERADPPETLDQV